MHSKIALNPGCGCTPQLPRPEPGQHRPHGPEHDQYIEPRREIFEGEKVILELQMDIAAFDRELAEVDCVQAITDLSRRRA